MGLALRSGTGFLAPLAGWIARRAAMYAIPGGTVAPGVVVAPVVQAPPVPVYAAKPLRVLRVVDGSARACAGRIRMSGRMADVCAELDRLAAREAQAMERGLNAG